MKSMEMLTGIGLMLYVGPSLCSDLDKNMKEISGAVAGLRISCPAFTPITTSESIKTSKSIDTPMVSPYRDEELQFEEGAHIELAKRYQTVSAKITRRNAQGQQVVVPIFKSESLFFEKVRFKTESRKDYKKESPLPKSRDSSENETNVQFFPMDED